MPPSVSTWNSRRRSSTNSGRAEAAFAYTAAQAVPADWHAMDIFDALIQRHDLQRSIAKRLLSDIGDKEQRAGDFEQLKAELAAHETAEERAFYVPLIEIDETVDAARHGIAEHHEMDEMVECIDKLDAGSAEWLQQLGALIHKLEHHLKEEEERWFPEARKVLSRREQENLGRPYQEEHDRLKAKEGQS